MKRGGPIKRNPEKDREWRERSAKRAAERDRERKLGPAPRRKPLKRKPVSPASDEQREKVRAAQSIVSGEAGCDPAHVWPRSLGGCDDPLCVVPLTRTEHDAFDHGDLDLLPYLIRPRVGAPRIAELQHALGHAGGSLLRLLEHTTNTRYQPTGGPTR